MATVETPGTIPTMRTHERSTSDIAMGVPLGEAVGGLATLILAIVGLAGLDPRILAGIAALVMGASLVCEGAGLIARFTQVQSDEVDAAATAELGGSSAEFLGGAAGIILGVLALINIYPWVLLPVAVLVFGASILLGAGSGMRMSYVSVHAGTDTHRHIAHHRIAKEMACVARSAELLVGLTALILGILAVTGVSTANLTLVAFLCLGAGILANGAAVSNRMASFLHTER